MSLLSLATLTLGSLAILPSALASTSYAISPSKFPNLCLAPSASTDGAKLVLADCDTSEDIAFTLDGSTLVNSATNMCIDVTDGGNWSGNKLQFWECFSGNQNQAYGLSGDQITWGSNMCLDLTDGNGQVGNQIQIWSCYSHNDNQKWTFTEVEEVDDGGSSCDTTATVSAAISVTPTASITSAASSTTDFYSASVTETATANGTVIGGELWGHKSSSSSSGDWSETTTSSDDWSSATATSSGASWGTASATTTTSSGGSWETGASTTASSSSSAATASATGGSSSGGSPISNSGILQASGTKVVDPSGNEVILRGPNIGGWLVSEDWMCGITDNSGNSDRFMQVTLESRFGEDQTLELLNAWYDNYMTSGDFAQIAGMGFNVIRLPFGFRNLQKADGSWRSDAFDRMDWAIAQAKANGLYVIPVFHIWDTQQQSYSMISENTDDGQSSRDRAGEIWKKVATHYLGETAIAAYDAINEPTGSWGDLLQQDLYNAIRSVDANRIIIMESINTPPSTYGWTQVMYSMHEYLMMDGDSSAWSGAQNDINTWNGYNIPTYIGEFMAHSNDGTLSTILTQLNQNNVWWSSWSWKTINMGGWGLMNFPAVYVDVSSDSFDSIKSAWSNLGQPSQNSDIYSMYQSAATGSTSFKRSMEADVVEKSEIPVKVTSRAGEIPSRRLPGSHRRSRRFSGHAGRSW